MRLIVEEKFNKRISKNFDYNFAAEKEGLYLLEISACTQSAKQIGAGATDDEDLRLEIDSRRFPKLDNPQRYLDSPAAFSGGLLHNFEKTVYFLANFSAGSHQLAFVPDQNPLLEKLVIYFLGAEIAKVDLDINQQAEDGDRRPWLTFILIDLPLQSLTAKVTARWRWPDSDDVKLIIDGKVQKNNLFLFYRNWLWSGSIFKKLFQSETQTKTIQTNLSSGLHYLEFWADRLPTLHNLELNLGEIKPQEKKLMGRIALYPDIEQTDFVRLREKPTTESKEMTKLKHGEEVEILEERVTGEWILNKSYVWHKVKYQDKTGYVVSSYVEIEGQQRPAIIDKIKQKAKDLKIDENLVLALAGCESRYKPYAASTADPNQAAKGVFQLAEQLIADLNNSTKPFYSPISDAFNIDQNITAGIKFFKWLFQEKYQDDENRLQKSIVAYNAGPYSVLPNEPLNLELFESQTQNLVTCVLENKQRKNWKFIFWPVIIFLFLISGGIGIWYLNQLNFFPPVKLPQWELRTSIWDSGGAKPRTSPAAAGLVRGKI